MSTQSKVGKYDPDALNGKSFKKRKYFKIEENKSNIFRILPPYGANNIYAFHQIFWLKGASGKSRPVSSLLKMGRDRTIIQRCPIYDKVEALKVQLAAISNDPNYDQNLIKAKKEQLNSLRLQKGYYMNVMDQAGDIGVLRVPYTAYQSLKKKLETLKAEGVDPINPGPQNGVFFDFKRYKDEKGKTIYEVEISQKTRRDETTGRMVKEYNWAPIDETVIKRLESEGAELSTMYRALSMQEMNLLATLDPVTIDSVFANPENSAEEEFGADDYEETEGGTATATATVGATAQTAAPVAQATQTAATQPASTNTAAMRVDTQVSNDDLVNQFLRNNG
jgi:hypothetical protein